MLSGAGMQTMNGSSISPVLSWGHVQVEPSSQDPEAPLTLLLSSSEAEAERKAVGHEALCTAEAGSEKERSRTLCSGSGEASQQYFSTRAARAGDGKTTHPTFLSGACTLLLIKWSRTLFDHL